MEIIELTEDNISQYEGFIPMDMADNITRVFYHGLMAEDDKKPVAGMIWEFIDATSGKEDHIVWLVAKDGDAAKLLFEKYDEFVRENEVSRTTFVLPAKESKEEKALLKEMGFSVQLTEGDMVSFKLSEALELSLVSKVKPGESIQPLRTATQRGYVGAIRRLVTGDKVGDYRDIAYLPRVYFENDVSCYSEENGEINGLFLGHLRPSGILEVVLMTAVGKNYVRILPQMLSFAIRSAGELYDHDTKIIFNRRTEASLALGEKLFPAGFGIPMFAGERTEQE